MGETYTQKLVKQIKSLEDDFDEKSLQLIVIENELKDNMEVSVLVSKLTKHILQMLIEYGDFIKNKTETEAHKRSRKRLSELLDISSRLTNIDSNSQSFMLFNRELATKIQLLRIENSELKRQIENMVKAEEYGIE